MSQPEGVNRRVMRELREIASVPVLSHKQWDAQYRGVYLTRRETRVAVSPACPHSQRRESWKRPPSV